MRSLFLGVLFLISQTALASHGLVIHTAEFGVGKFHRMDNKIHPHAQDHAWIDYILPDGVNADHAVTVKNADGSFTVFYSTLEEMLAAVVTIAHQNAKSVSVLNIHGHGLPGAMWFPPNEAAKQDSDCDDWNTAASGSDDENYHKYYSELKVEDIENIRFFANYPELGSMKCTTGLPEWKSAVAKNRDFTKVLETDAQVHLLSCVVGLGKAGAALTEGLASLLFSKGSAARIETSTYFGLGDWSMPKGMGFWDMQSESQVDHDSQVYLSNKRDADIAQKGTVRTASAGVKSQLIANQDVMHLNFVANLFGPFVAEPVMSFNRSRRPTSLRIPGTNARVQLQ